MQVQVVRVEQGEAGLRAALKTSGGIIWAYWRGDPPTRGQFTDVELAVTRVVSWGQELEPLTEGAGRAALEVLHGTLERIDADGSAELRVGGATLIVSTQGTPPPVGTKVRLSGCEITAYPSYL
ncbi:MAG TPA: hypothetical protein VE153_35205 [Myxococcus sp.]|nr:hypothetical protein [Myxococcus sp.]